MTNRIWGCLLLSLLSAASADVASPKPTPWSVIAGSDVIVVGTIEDIIEDPAPKEHVPGDDYRTGKVDIVVQRVLKGSAPGKLRASYIGAQGISVALPAVISGLRGKTAIVYLMTWGQTWPTHGQVFDMSEWFGMDVLIPDSAGAEQRIHDELAHEPQLASESALYLSKLDGGEVESQVEAAIDGIASSSQDRVDAGEDKLRKLGCEAVPYIIKHMDDRRPFQVILKGPSTWEAYAQYKPKQVTGALSMVLGFITAPARPERDEYHVDDAESRKVIDSWLLYYAHHRLNDANDPSEFPDMCSPNQAPKAN